jgi:hypothetical protein
VALFGGLVLALAGCGGGSDSGTAASESISNTTDTLPTNDATTTEAESSIGQGVDQTCEDLVAFFTLAKETDIARGGNSVDDVKKLAAAASDLASKAPAEPSGFNQGEPRHSLQHMADGYGHYVSLLSELGLDPGPDALLEPRVADALSGLDDDVLVGIGPWFDARCSSELKAQMEQLVNG